MKINLARKSPKLLYSPLITRTEKSEVEKPLNAFCGEIYMEDPKWGNQSLYAFTWDKASGKPVIELHNAYPPKSIETLIGIYNEAWTLKRVKWGLLVRVYEMSFLRENPPVKVRCVAAHKFGKMLETAIERLSKKSS